MVTGHESPVYSQYIQSLTSRQRVRAYMDRDLRKYVQDTIAPLITTVSMVYSVRRRTEAMNT